MPTYNITEDLPFASWLLDEDTCQWEAPVAYPTDGKLYTWNEKNQDWSLFVTKK
jgi:hypothetical protein